MLSHGQNQAVTGKTCERQWISQPLLLPDYRASLQKISWRSIQMLCVYKNTPGGMALHFHGWGDWHLAAAVLVEASQLFVSPLLQLHKQLCSHAHCDGADSSSSQLTSWNKTMIMKLAWRKITEMSISKHHYQWVNALDSLLWVCNALGRGTKQMQKAKAWVYTKHTHEEASWLPGAVPWPSLSWEGLSRPCSPPASPTLQQKFKEK